METFMTAQVLAKKLFLKPIKKRFKTLFLLDFDVSWKLKSLATQSKKFKITKDHRKIRIIWLRKLKFYFSNVQTVTSINPMLVNRKFFSKQNYNYEAIKLQMA